MNQRSETAEIWKSIWGRKTKNELSKWDNLSQSIHEILRKEIGDVDNKEILEAGSGTGRISLRLAKNGADVTLLDTAPTAMKIARNFFREETLEAKYICGSIFKMPFRDNLFDVVWNAGVLEHFSEKDRFLALKHMIRVCKKNGLIITLNPFSGAIFYRIGKWIAERTNTWSFGYEKPIATLREPMTKHGVYLKQEYPAAFYEQFNFLSCMPLLRYLVYIINKKIRKTLPKLDNLPGYLLVSIGKKYDSQ